MALTKEEKQAMADAMLQMDKDVITGVEQIMKNYEAAIDALLADLPDSPPPQTAAFQFAARMRSALSGAVAYELPNLKNQYGIGGPTTPMP